MTYWEKVRANRSETVANLSGISMLECYHMRVASQTWTYPHSPVIPHCPSSDLLASHFKQTRRRGIAASEQLPHKQLGCWICSSCSTEQRSDWSILLSFPYTLHYHPPILPLLPCTVGGRCAGFITYFLSFYVCGSRRLYEFVSVSLCLPCDNNNSFDTQTQKCSPLDMQSRAALIFRTYRRTTAGPVLVGFCSALSF